MNALELETVEGAAYMAFGELEYAQHNKRLLEALKSKPEMLPEIVEVWLNEWERMAEEMIDQCASMYVFGAKGEGIFDHDGQLEKEKSKFRSRIQKMREDSITEAAAELKRLLGIEKNYLDETEANKAEAQTQVTTTGTEGGDTKACPYCDETIKAQAIVCRYCGRDLPELVSQSLAENKRAREQVKKLREIVCNYQADPKGLWYAMAEIYEQLANLAAQTKDVKFKETVTCLILTPMSHARENAKKGMNLEDLRNELLSAMDEWEE